MIQNRDMPLRSAISVVGKLCILHTNSYALEQVVTEYFQINVSLKETEAQTASLWFHVREEKQAAPEGDSFPATPHFRGFGPFVFATFGPSNRITFDLLQRTVIGEFSSSMLKDTAYWERVILPVIVGIMSASLGIVAVHSACLLYRGEGVLLSGYSGVGKSTLATALARTGLPLLSDDWTYVSYGETGLNAWGLPIPVKLLPDAIRFFPELKAAKVDKALNGELSFEFFPEELMQCSRSLYCKPKVFLLLERAVDAPTRWEAVDSETIVSYLADGLEELPPEIAQFRQPQIDILNRLAECKLYRVRLHGTPDSTAQDILQLCHRLLD